MLIAQILHPKASFYDRKSQALDAAALAAHHEVLTTSFEGASAAGAAIAHVYGPAGFSPPPRQFTIPYVASAEPQKPRFPWRKPIPPRAIVSPLDNLPEAVDEVYFDRPAPIETERTPKVLGTFGRDRKGVLSMIELTLARIHRFREDVDWLLFDHPPAPDDLALVDAWVDPATSEDDYDGFVAEAVVSGKVVVASRVAINTKRLDKGMSGFLVPPSDPNELAHAILAALFKSEVALKKIEAARQTAGKFRARQRLRLLEKIYQAALTP
jgi:Glycosyl transferases group 1